MLKDAKRVLSPFLSNRSALCLALCCLVIYVSKGDGVENESTALSKPSDSLYVEVAEAGDFPVIFKVDGGSGLERITSLYSLQRKLKNGDKLVLHAGGTVGFSRISGKKSLALGTPIGINSADVDDLLALPGIGTRLAQRIIEYRDLNKGFKSIDELDKVEGIGRKKLEAIRPLISLD